MKKWCFLTLYFGFSFSTVFQISAQELPDAITWEQLKKSSSTSITAAAGNCQKWINEAKSNCKASIDHAMQLITQKKDNVGVQTLIFQETIEEVSSILQSVSSNVFGQLSEVGNRFQKRLEQVINSSNSLQPEILNELKGTLKPPVDQSDQMLASIRQLFSPSYNPSTKLKEGSTNELGKMAVALDLEIDQLQKAILVTLNHFNKGIIIAKDTQVMVKKSGQLPQNWISDNLKSILSNCAQITSTLQFIGKTPNQNYTQAFSKAGKPQEQKSKVMSMRQTINDELSLIEEEIELDDEDNESGCGQIFEQSKHKIRTKLVATVKEIKKAIDAKSIDLCTSNVLESYGELLSDVSHKINGKIIDFTHQFIKLYKSVSDIMETINTSMNEKMVEIFNDQNTDATDFYYNNIRKYFADTYLTEAKMHDLYNMVANCMKTSKTRKSLQKQIIKQLSTVTSDLVRDMDTMKSTTVYILLEIRKGVSALQNLKNKSNVSGIRYWFNFYDGKTDLSQVKKIIYIINAVNIHGIFEREMTVLQSSVSLTKCETTTEMIQETLSQRTSDLLIELDQKTNLQEVELVRSKFLQTFNSVMTVYRLKVKKVMKQTVVTFINVYEETLITLKRKNMKDVHFLDAIFDNETRNIDSDIPIFAIYLAKSKVVNVEQDTGITLRRKFKNLGEAKYTLKSSINEICQVISTHMIEMKTGIQTIMTIIAEESQHLQQIQRNVENNNNDYIIDMNKLNKLEYLMKLANTLKISHGDITNGLTTNVNSSNQQLESYLDNAIERLRSEKQNALIEMEKCLNVKQLQIQVTTVTTRLKEIISDTVMEVRSDINRYTAQYKAALNTYIKCTNHETLFKVLERGRNNNSIQILLSEHLQTYLKDKYSQVVLETFSLSAHKNKNIKQCKSIVIESLSATVKQIENDMSSAKSEALNTIFSTFKQAIDILEMVNSSEIKHRLDEEKIQTLITLSRLLKILHEDTAIDAEDSINQAIHAINTARDASNSEYTRSVPVLSSTTNTNDIQTEMKNIVNLFESIYNTMRQQIKSKMETLSIDHYERFKIMNAQTLGTKQRLQEIMGGIYSKEFIKKEEYQKFSSFINSESYTSSLTINSIYEKLQNNHNTRITNGQCLNILNNLNTEMNNNINNMEEIVKYISNIYRDSTNIIVSINKGKGLEITDVYEISILTQSLLIYQTLLQVQNKADFSGVQKTIQQEYGEAMQTIVSANNENIVQETIARSIEKYDTVTNILENEVTQKFMKITADFTNKYETAMQAVIAENNEELLAILQNIVENKVCDTVSEKYKKFESYINSCNFRSTTFAKDSYQNIIGQKESSLANKDINLEQLKILTDKVEEYFQELDIESQFANEHFLKGTNILQSIQNGNFKLTEEQIQMITECVMISQMIFKQNFSSITSKNDEEWEAISTAKKSINEEYNYAVVAIKSTKEKVIIEQIIATSIYKYDDVYNNLREEMKQTFSTLQIDFTSTYDTITEILMIQNIPMYNRLQKIQNNPTNISIKYTKFESYIKSETFTSYSLIRYELLKLKQGEGINKVDTYAKQLSTLTKITNKQIEELSLIQKYVTEVLHRSIEILQNTETDVNIQLNEEQFTILCEVFKISKIIEAVISSEEQIDEKFLLAERSINDIYESTINEMQAVTYNESIANCIQNFTIIYNNLRVNVQEMFTHKSTFFVNTFSVVSKSMLLQNSKLSSTFDDIKKNKINTKQFSKKYQELITYINSDKFSSTSYISYMYQNIRMQGASSVINIKETNVEQLTKLTDAIREIITEMNQSHQVVTGYFNENIEYLKAIEDGTINNLSQEQMMRLTECVNISETVTFTCVTVSEEREIIFKTAESTISDEFEKTISSIIQVRNTSEMIQIIDTNIQYCEETYNILKKKVKETLIQTSTEFSKYYKKILENVRSQKILELQTFLEDLQTTKKLTALIESYKNCKIYLNSESFKSSSWVLQYYNKNAQQIKEVTKEVCIKELQTITSEVNHQITQARFTSKYIVQLFEQSIDVFKLLESNTANQQLTHEQKQLLTESMILLEQISYKFSAKSQQEEALYATTQTTMRNTYNTAIITIKNTKETQVIKQTLLESAKNYNDFYNSYRKEVKNIFTQTITEFSETFDAVIKQTINKNRDLQLQTTLHNIKNSKVKIQTSEKYTKFESYIITEKFVSTNIVKRLYSKIEIQTQSSNQINNEGLHQLRSLTNEADILVDELYDMCQYISETIQESSTILKSIENSGNVKLTQEQITILTESILINEIISLETSSVSQKEELIFTTAENSIEEKQNNVINIITSSKDMEEVKTAIKTTMKNYDEIYNKAKDEVKERFITAATEFNQTYEKIIEIFKTQEKSQIHNLLQNIQKETINTEISQRYKNFERYLRSEVFTTVLLATHTYQNLTKHSTSTDLREEGIRDTETIAVELQSQLNEMNAVQKYVSQTLQRSTRILKTLECDVNITEITQEEITILIESIMILETINTELNSTKLETEEIFTSAEIKVDQEYDNALNKIRTATDEETIMQTMQESIETYDITVKSIQEEVKHTFTETATQFISVFDEILDTTTSHTNEAVKTTLQDIRDHKVEVEVSEEYVVFEEFVSSETFSTFSAVESYNEIQKEGAVDIETMDNMCVNQLEKLTTKVNKYITQTHTVRKYITRIFEKSTKILKVVEQEKNIELTKEQASILNESVMISEKLSLQADTSQVSTEKVIMKECETAIELIQSTTTEEGVQKVINKNIKSYSRVYCNMEEKMKTTLTKTSTEFTKTFDTFLQTLDDTNLQILKEIENSKQEVKHDKKLIQFKSYMENKHLSSIDTINEMYTNISQSKKNQLDFKEQGIKEIKDLSTNVNNKLIEMDEYQKYATKNIAKGQAILQNISEHKNINFDKEQIIAITKTVEIIETIKRNMAIKQDLTNIEESKRNKEKIQIKEKSENKFSKNKESDGATKNVMEIEGAMKTQLCNLAVDKSEEKKPAQLEHTYTNNKCKQTNENQEITQHEIKKQESIDIKTCDIVEVQNIVKEEHDATIELINLTENEEKVQKILQEHIEQLDKTYNDAQQSTKTQIAQTSSNYTSHVETTMNEVENTQVCETLNKALNEDTDYAIEDDEELKNFITCVTSKNFLSDSIRENIKQETLNDSDIKGKSIQEVDHIDKKASENLKEMEKTSKFVSENLKKSDSILEKVRLESEVQLNKEEIKQIARSAKINKVLQESETFNLSNESNKKSVGTIDSLTRTSKNIQGVNESSKVEERKAIEQSTNIENQNFAIYQSSINEDTESGNNEMKRKEQEETATEKEETGLIALEKVDQVYKQNNKVKAEEQACTELIQENHIKPLTVTEEESPIQSKNKEMKIDKPAVTENGVIEDNETQQSMVKTEAIQSQSQELKVDQATIENNTDFIGKENKHHQLFTKAQIQNTEHKKSEKREQAQEVKKTEKVLEKEKRQLKPTTTQEIQNSKRERGKQSIIENENHTVNYTAVQNIIELENSAIIDSIKQIENEEHMEEMVKEHIQTLNKTYENARHNAESEITHNSDAFVNTLQSTLNHVQSTEIQNTLNGIMNENLNNSVQEDEELEKLKSYIKSDTFSSTFTVTNVHQSIQENETTSDVKEKSIQEIETIGAKVNENLRTMEETTKFVSENLQKSADILKKVESDTATELNREEVNQISKSIKITKILYEREIIHSDNQVASTRSINTPSSGSVTATKNSIIQNTHTNTKIEEEIKEQSTLTTTEMDTKSIFSNLVEEDCLSVEPQKCHEDKNKVLEKVSTSNLLVNWEIMKSEDKCWPAECRNLSWNSKIFSDSTENKIFVEEISQILKISQNLIENTINIELKKLKLNRKVREDLSAMTVCVDNIYNILQRLSTYVFEEMERFSGTIGSQIKTTSIEEKLKMVTATLDDEFMAVGKAFFDLQYSKSSDMLDLIDQKYENEICDTISKSRKVAIEKLEELQSTTNTILDNIDCLVLTMLDTFVSAELTIQNLAKGGDNVSLESLKNCQRLYEVLEI